MDKEKIKSRFFEDDLATETVKMARVILETVDNDPPVTTDTHAKNMMGFTTDILERFIQYSGWGEWSEGVDDQTKAIVEYLPWALLGRVTAEAALNLKYGRDTARSVRIYQEIASKLELDNNPRRLSGLVDEKTGITLDLIEGVKGVDLDLMMEQIRIINEAMFPSGF